MISSEQDSSSPYSSEHTLEPSSTLLAPSRYYCSSPPERNERHTVPYHQGDHSLFTQLDSSSYSYYPQNWSDAHPMYPYMDSVCISNPSLLPSAVPPIPSSRHRKYSSQSHPVQYQPSYSYPTSPCIPLDALQSLTPLEYSP